MRLAPCAFFACLTGCQLIGYELGRPFVSEGDATVEELDAGMSMDIDASLQSDAMSDASADASDASDTGPACLTTNACGGCTVLSQAVDGACGKCALGRYTCDGTERVVCTGAAAVPMSSGAYLIDNWDDGNDMTASGEGHSFASSDGTASAMLEPAAGARIKAVPGGALGTPYAARLKGSGFRGWGASIVIWLDNSQCAFDASAQTGISFYVKGVAMTDGQVAVATSQTWLGADCERGCNDFHAAPVKLTPDWTRYTVDLRDLKQGGFGTAADLDPTQLRYIQFAFPGNTPFELFLDEVSFY